jgi:hypothetical protein
MTLRTVDFVAFPQAFLPLDDEKCSKFEKHLHDTVLDQDHFGEARVHRSGEGLACSIRVLSSDASDGEIQQHVESAWASGAWQ